ncbi:MAG: hypothetical protein FWG11_03530 [Promicromonosporaceae bacterium]|nr:hypothetical protein [Promicromonosporaceae bacterium]
MKYTVTVTREGKWWVGEVNGLRGGATEAARLADLETEVRDLIAGLLDVGDDDFELSWDLSAVIGPQGQEFWEAFVAEREELHERRRRFEAERLSALKALRDGGISLRDAATLVDLSHQRVAQLLSA